MKKISFNSTLKVMIIIIIGKVFGLIRDALIASNFGLSIENDIYTFALGSTMLLISISYGITNAFIPLFNSMLISKSKEENNYFINNMITIITIVAAIVVLICGIFAKNIVIILAPTIAKDNYSLQQAIFMFRVMIISVVFIGAQSVLSGVLQNHNHFTEVAFGPISPNIINIIYLLIFINFYGLIGFGVFTAIGFLMMLLVLVPRYIKLGYKYRPVLYFRQEEVKLLFRNVVPIIFSTSLAQINIFILRFYAGKLPQGGISSVEYANKINMLVYEVIGQAIILIVYPKLGKLLNRDNYDEFNEELSKGIIVILMLTVPAASALFLLGESVISVYLMRGNFGYSEVLQTAAVLKYYIPTIIFYGIRDLISRAFFSVNKANIAAFNSIICIGLNFIFAPIFLKILGAPGLALGNSLAVTGSCLIFYYQLKKETKIILEKKTKIVKIIVANLIMIGLINIIMNYIKSSFLLIIVSFFLGLLTYFASLYILRFRDFKELLKK
ncbi:MAG: murein biosynthesis integral membrane protein MurJ [Clostridiales bacterium]|uniref:murein biosynthesis integral membrane protein MurJ n=1 Tax=Clostridium sp. N3C TaxID=1776758 RepID=UPI00092E136A|nr:murein biosynthesis integral membrane protein MurJ [Clostridium sp. N3C]NLZ48457.1 murein biosynthesis integral membrane protein MurJ [Clostridiales bacterium]SCN21468.1 putative peptidoglycan biosynthesis protein MurJ [Clostridium sp. N3C]